MALIQRYNLSNPPVKSGELFSSDDEGNFHALNKDLISKTNQVALFIISDINGIESDQTQLREYHNWLTSDGIRQTIQSANEFGAKPIFSVIRNPQQIKDTIAKFRQKYPETKIPFLIHITPATYQIIILRSHLSHVEFEEVYCDLPNETDIVICANMAGTPGGFANGLSFLEPKRNIIATSLQKVIGISFERQSKSGKPSYYMNFNNESIPAIIYRDGQISDPLAHDMERQMYDQFGLKWSIQELKNQDNLAIDESNKQIKLRDLFIYNASKINAIVNNVNEKCINRLEEETKKNEENLDLFMALAREQTATIDSILETANKSLDLSKKQTRKVEKLSFFSSISLGVALAGIFFSISKMDQYLVPETL